MTRSKSVWQLLPSRTPPHLSANRSSQPMPLLDTSHSSQQLVAAQTLFHSNPRSNRPLFHHFAQTVVRLLGKLQAIAVGILLLFALAQTAQADWFDMFSVERLWSGGSSEHSCAVLPGGSAKCWGRNDNGQLGNDSTTDSFVPVDVYGLPTTAVDELGNPITIYGTPTTTHGFREITVDEFGNPDTIYDEFGNPITIYGSPGTTTIGVHEITLGEAHACALTNVGGVKCWGSNGSGQLGNDSTEDSAVPVDVLGLSRGVKAVATGRYNSCAVLSNGTVQCWGYNRRGELGNALQLNSRIPTTIEGLSGVTAVAMGRFHGCALLDADYDGAGHVKCWGRNGSGQIGDGTTTTRFAPVSVVNLTSDVQAIAAGAFHSCALKTDGAVYCWGRNTSGQLGDNSTQYTRIPVQVMGLNNATMLAVGETHSCALTSSNVVKCWGSNHAGQLGIDMAQTQSLVPVTVNQLSAVKAVATGREHSCALTANAGVKCWGENFHGQLGNGSNANSETPVIVLGTSADAVVGAINAKLQLEFIERQGEVTLSPAGAACGEHCYDFGAAPVGITLTATPAVGYQFSRWSRDCRGTDPELNLTLEHSADCAAYFKRLALDYVLQVEVEGEGEVSVSESAGNCGTNCYDFGETATEVELTATPAAGYTFLEWAGDCSGDSETQTILVDNPDVVCTAVFVTAQAGVAAYFLIGTSTDIGTVFVQLVNRATESVTVTGTVYDQSGHPIGTPDTVLIAELAGNATVELSASQLANLFGPIQGYSWLEITSPVQDIALFNYLRSPTGMLSNLSVTDPKEVSLLIDHDTHEFNYVNYVTVINREDVPVQVSMMVIDQAGHVVATPQTHSLLAFELAPKAMQIMPIYELYYGANVSWSAARLQVLNTNAPHSDSIQLLNVVQSLIGDILTPGSIHLTNPTAVNPHAVYNVGNAHSPEDTTIYITNTSHTAVSVTAVLYDSAGQILGSGEVELVPNLAPYGTAMLSSTQLETAFATWSGLATLVIAYPTADLRVYATKYSAGVLTDATTVSDTTAYGLANSVAIDSSLVRITNISGETTEVRGTLYNYAGEVIGEADSILISQLAGDATAELTMQALENAVEATPWNKRARLEITAPITGVKVMTLTRSVNGALTNMSGVQER